jgi:rRNA-processing protein FCF1
LYNFLRISNSEVEFKIKARFLVRSLIQDLKKTEFVELAILINEKQINDKVPSNVNVDDHYLVLAYFYFKTKEDTIIVTTDKKLKETLEQNGIFIKFRDEFLSNY